MATITPPTLFISAAEPSGDIIAAEIMGEILKDRPVNFIGIGGELMTKKNLTSLFPMSELTVMGFLEVLPKARAILRRIRETADYIMQEKPEVILTVDAYSFHKRLATRLRKKGYTGRIVHFVPPAVWAWKESRAKDMAKYYDEIFCIFPFEPDYFTKHDLKATFVGHPAIYRTHPKDPGFRKRYNLKDDQPILTLLPGSRLQEIKSLLPIYLDAAQRIRDQYPDVALFIPTFEHFAPLIQELAEKNNLPIQLLTTNEDKYACFHETNLAIATSGTVGLELALYQVPTIISYRASQISYWLAKAFAKVNYITMANIIVDKEIIPEFVQGDCTVENITRTALELLGSTKKREKMKADQRAAIATLKSPTKHLPQQTVAQALFS